MRALRVPPALMRLGARRVSRHAFDTSLPWEVQRRRLDRLVRSWPLRRGTSVTKTVLNGVSAEVVTATRTPAVTVVHFHGGGYCVGSPAEARGWAAYLSARADCRMILPDYQLAPEHPYPAALEDARAVLRAVLADAEPGRSAEATARQCPGAARIFSRRPGCQWPGGIQIAPPRISPLAHVMSTPPYGSDSIPMMVVNMRVRRARRVAESGSSQASGGSSKNARARTAASAPTSSEVARRSVTAELPAT